MTSKISKLKVLAVLASIIFLFTIFMFLNAGGTKAYADPEDTPSPTDTPTPQPTNTPAPTATAQPTPTSIPGARLTSATYNVGTGELILTGTGFTAVAKANDIDSTKLRFSDTSTHMFTLTSTTKGVEITNDNTATITVSSKDMSYLTAWMDKAGTKNAAGNAYNIGALPGWNGPTSLGDLSGNAVTVSGIATLESATYDITTKKLVLTGTNLVMTASSTGTDITPKYLIISDGAYNTFTLSDTKAVKATDKTTATLTIADKDAAVLATWINKNGTSDSGGYTYNVDALAGWNGATSIGDQGNTLTVSNYASPRATVTTAAVTMSSSAKVVGASSDKSGTIYLIPASTDISNFAKSDLEALVTAKNAIKADAGTAPKGIAIKDLKFSDPTLEFKIVAVDTAGTLSSMSTGVITISNYDAPALTAKAAAGTVEGSTAITVTAASGDTLKYIVSDTKAATPKVGAAVPDAAIAYTSGSDITGVDTKKFIAIYEIDSRSKVVKFYAAAVSSIKADKTAPTLSSATIDAAKKIVTITLSENIVNAGATDAVLKGNVKIATDGTTYTALGTSDTVVISGKTLVVTFNTALTTAANKIQITKAALKDASKNATDLITTGAINASDSSTATVAASTGTPTQSIAFNLNITGGKDSTGTNLSGSINVMVTSSDTSEGTAGVVHNATVTFAAGSATVPVTLANTGAQTLTVTITGVTATKTVDVTVQ